MAGIRLHTRALLLVLLLGSLGLLAAGCTIPYMKPGVTEEQMRVDRESCRQAAVEKYAQVLLPEPHAFFEMQHCMEAKGYRVSVP